MLNIGFLPFEAEKLNTIRQILTDRLNRSPSIFEERDEETLRWGRYLLGTTGNKRKNKYIR